MRRAWGAVGLVARVELRRRWRATLGLGAAFGLLAAVVVGALAVAQRTSTAYDRLAAATAIDDARALLFTGELADEVAALPSVASSWNATLAIARADGPGVRYTGWLLGPEPPPGLFAPVVVDGRAADPAALDEVTVTENYADAFGVDAGDEIGFTFLAPEEVSQFDTGFGAPDGPHVTVTVAGVVRLPGGQDQMPILASAAFAERYAEDVGAGASLALRLRGGPEGIDRLRAEVDAVVAASAVDVGDFAPVEITSPTANRSAVVATSNVLVGGLGVFAAAAAVVGLIAVGQALYRHHGLGAAAQSIEAALGLTAGERATARLVAMAPSAAVAGIVTVAGGLAAGAVEPLGSLRRFEPAPGWAPNVAVALAGGVVSVAVTALLTVASARRAGAPAPLGVRRRVTRPRLTGVPLPAPAAVGVGLAVTHPDAGRSAPTRTSLAGAVIAVGGVVAAVVFGASLGRLVDEPSRWGWSGDVLVIDVDAAIVDELLADPRVAELTVVEAVPVRIAGQDVQAEARTDRRGSLGWTVLEGRPPRADDEMLLGSAVARTLDAEVGDVVDADGGPLSVVGIGIGMTEVGDTLGDNVLLTPAALEARGEVGTFTEAAVRATEGQARSLVDDLGARYEISLPEPPAAVANLDELAGLPGALGVLLGLIGIAALAHALTSTVRRRRRDLAVLRALGFSARQTGLTLASMATTTAGIGLLVGVPLGLAIGRLVWWAVADATGVATDPAVPIGVLLVVSAAVPVAALLAAGLPARRARSIAPGVLFREE